jgi:hypothetical protein
MSDLKHSPAPWRKKEIQFSDESTNHIAVTQYRVFDKNKECIAVCWHGSDADVFCAAPETAAELDQLREENELLKERCSVLLQALVDYFNHSVPIDGTKALSANLAVAHLIQKYSRQ